MLVLRIRLARLKRRLVFLAAVAVFAALFTVPQAAANGVRHGLAVCGQLLVPSLFPFLVVTGFLVKGGFIHALGRRAEPLMRRLFGLSGHAAGVVLLSMLGGYPTGASAVAGLVERGELDRAEARRVMHCAVHAGPAFVIGGVGIGMLHSAEAGALLLAAHLLASVIVMLIERRQTPPAVQSPEPPLPLARAVTESVHGATASLLSMCGFVLLASVVLSIVDAMGGGNEPHAAWRCLLGCVTEVTTGCMEAAGMGASAPFWIGATLGFGGLSVIGQVAAVTAEHHLLDLGFLRTRLLHALLGGTLSSLLFHLFPPPREAVSAMASLSAFHTENPLLAATALLALMLLCVLFLQTLPCAKRSYSAFRAQ